MQLNYLEVYNYWFKELTPKDWFAKNDTIDHYIKDHFYNHYIRASLAELSSWRQTAQGALAEIIILDQFSRNIFRNSPKAFALDSMALTLSQEAIRKGQDQELSLTERAFLYMPFMHSESAQIHEEAVKLFSIKGLENNLNFEIKHKEIIDRFGRYPHRNIVLNRVSTEEEIEFLKSPGSSF